MGYPIQHIVGFDGIIYDIPTGGIKHLSFVLYDNDDNRRVHISVPSDISVGDVVVLDKYNSGGYYWPGTTNQSDITIWAGGFSKYDDSKVVALDASYDYILICNHINNNKYTFKLISGGAPAIISYYRGTNGPRASSENITDHYAGTMGAIPTKKVNLSASQLTLSLSPNTATAKIINAHVYLYNCGKYAIIAEVTASESANVVDITVPNAVSSWFRLNAPSFIQFGSSSDQYGSFCTKTTAQKSTVDDNTHIRAHKSSSSSTPNRLIIVGDYFIAKP